LREYDQALSDLTRAIELEPSLVLAHQNLGGVYQLMGEYQKLLRPTITLWNLTHITSLRVSGTILACCALPESTSEP
jgi:tetratricopeptide (TPR) repeat protein